MDMNPRLTRGMMAMAALLMAAPALAQDTDRDRTRQELQDRDRIYGSQLMTPQERAEYRDRMRSMTPSQRAKFRQEHRRRMDQRARQRGVRLPSRDGDQGNGGGTRKRPGSGGGMGGGGRP